jgi:hypothetical protein
LPLAGADVGALVGADVADAAVATIRNSWWQWGHVTSLPTFASFTDSVVEQLGQVM